MAEVFTLILIKPTHYDDDGYPIQWMRSSIPANTLATLSGLAVDCQERRVLRADVDIQIHAIDETNKRVEPKKLIAEIRNNGGKGLVGFVGVQSNQFPRTCDLIDQFMDADVPVMVGGFHVSGCISMLSELPPEIKAIQDKGVSVCAGETENGRLDGILQDAFNGELKPLYNYMNDLPSLDGEPIPFLSKDMIDRTQGRWTSLDLGRGCPFQCSFCTIINVQGRKSRFRTPEDLEKIVRANIAQGIHRFFITDDNFARNKDWEIFLDKLIELRETFGLKIKLIMQVDTLCHRIPNFIEKSARAGVNRIFLGLENINPENLLEAKKRQNRITEYREMILEWRKYSVTVYAGYILGFPADTKASIINDVEIIKRELAIDILEFFYLTPLPGSEDHQKLHREGIWMDPDLNKYDLDHRVTHHSKMTDDEWEQAYKAAWETFYTKEHMVTIGKRASAMPDGRAAAKVRQMHWFAMMYFYEGVHPLEGGLMRRKYRTDRRPSLPRENPLVFYPKYWSHTLYKTFMFLYKYYEARKIWTESRSNLDRYAYTDIAITPPEDGDVDELEMFTETSGGQEAVAKQQAQEERIKKVAGAQAAE
ncbi:MAG: B12-binding domain-containing radical SAM protein [Hyphomicrobiales bacterium]